MYNYKIYREIINKKWDVEINEYDFEQMMSKNPTLMKNLILQELIIREYKQSKGLKTHYYGG